MSIRLSTAPLAFAAALAIAGSWAFASAARAQSDADFLAAKAAFDKADRVALDVLAPKLSGHVLEPYVRYWQLRLRLDAADVETMRAFLAREAGGPLADELRVAWLKSLASRGQWEAFGEELERTTSEDTELACLAAQYRRQREGDAALAAVKPLWFTGRSQPEACAPLFDALIANGDITVADRVARLRLASAAGNVRLAQAIGTALPSRERIAERDFARVDRDPLGALSRVEFVLKQPPGRELALYAVERAARKDLQATRAAWIRLRPLVPEADRLYANGRLAFHAARQLVPDANLWYREAVGAPLEAKRPGKHPLRRKPSLDRLAHQPPHLFEVRVDGRTRVSVVRFLVSVDVLREIALGPLALRENARHGNRAPLSPTRTQIAKSPTGDAPAAVCDRRDPCRDHRWGRRRGCRLPPATGR